MCGQKAPGGVQRLMNVQWVWWWHARINGTVRIALGRAQNGPKEEKKDLKRKG